MIYTGWVTLNGELLAYKLGGEYRTPEKLDPRADLRRYSEKRFQPSEQYGRRQLALAILADCLQDDEQALRHHEHFYARVISQLSDNWTLTPKQVRAGITTTDIAA